MHRFSLVLALTTGLALTGAPRPALAAAPEARAFVLKVGQGGMFEVEAGRLAADKASAVDVRDFAVMEVHDHTGVGDRLKAVSAQEGAPVPASLNAEFQGALHAADGAAFAKEAQAGGAADFRAFGRETHLIVARHIGAIHAAAPPQR